MGVQARAMARLWLSRSRGRDGRVVVGLWVGFGESAVPGVAAGSLVWSIVEVVGEGEEVIVFERPEYSRAASAMMESRALENEMI